MTDNRCPECNQPVKGRKDISDKKPKVPAERCQHCKVPLTLEFNNDGGGFLRSWFYKHECRDARRVTFERDEVVSDFWVCHDCGKEIPQIAPMVQA